jgi:tetratricopeptide (TPR) repeat protein
MALRKQNSVFISKEKHAQLRGIQQSTETIEEHPVRHVSNHHFEHIAQKETRALEKRNKNSRKNQKKMYANIKRDSIASASGRSLALSVVQQTAHAAMATDHRHHHIGNGEDSDSDDNNIDFGGRSLQYTEEHPLSLPTGKLLSSKTFLLAQEMKITIRKTKERQVVISVTDNHFREYAIIRSEVEILNVLTDERDKKRFCELERKLKLQLILSMVTFVVGKSRGKLKELTLVVPPKETLALFLNCDVEVDANDNLNNKEGNKLRQDDSKSSDYNNNNVGNKKPLHAGKGWFKAKLAIEKVNVNKYRELIRLNPLDPKGYISLGKFYLRHQKLKEGIDLFRSAIRIKHVNLQVKPFDGNFWKLYVSALNTYNDSLTNPAMETLVEATSAFQFSLRFFQNLTDPTYLSLGAKIQEKAGDIERSCQTLARIIQNFPSLKTLPSIVLKAASCELHRGNFPQSQSYFEFLLIDHPSKFTKDDIILLISLLLNLNKQTDSAMKGYKYLYDKLYDKGGLYTNGLYRKKSANSWSKCSDLWITYAEKILKKGEPLLANNLFKEGLFLGGYDSKHQHSHSIIGNLDNTNLSQVFDSLSSSDTPSLHDPSVVSPPKEEDQEELAIHYYNTNHFHNHHPIKVKATTWWKAAECAYSVKDFNFAAYCCQKTLFNDPNHNQALTAKKTWEVPKTVTSDFVEFKIGVDEQLMMEANLRKKIDQTSSYSPKSYTHNLNDNSLNFGYSLFPEEFEAYKYNDQRRRRPMGHKEAVIVKRLHEGLSADNFESALSNRKLSRGKKFGRLLTRAISMKSSKLDNTKPNLTLKSSGLQSISSNVCNPISSLRPQTAGSSRRRSNNSLGSHVMSRPISPTTLLTLGRTLKKTAAKTSGQMILENLQKQDVWNLSNINSTIKKVVTKRQRENIRKIIKQKKYDRSNKKANVLGSKLGLPIAYSSGSKTGIVPLNVVTRPPTCDTEARKSAHDFYDRDVARKKA